MTFEEFFNKKKIDLYALKQVNPLLFEEFKSHYALMGEKSFDHTKKYWFNKLRKDFLLFEVPSEVQNSTQKQAENRAENMQKTTDETATSPAGFKPRFKAATPPTNQPDDNLTETPASENQAEKSTAKPAGFKPRFKAATPPTNRPDDNLTETEKQSPQP